MMPEAKISLLLVGVSDLVASVAASAFKSADESIVKRIATADEFMTFLDSTEASQIHITIAGPCIAEMQTAEVAQALRGIMVGAPIFFANDKRESGYDRKQFVKNGFTDAFLLPLDASELVAAIQEVAARIKSMPVFRSVKMVDIEADHALDFDVHVLLPANQKYIRFSAAGQKIEGVRVERLKSQSVGSIFVPLEQMSQFYEYSGRRLKEMANDGSLSETERKEKVQTAVRDLMTGIFSTNSEGGFGEGKQVMHDASQIVQSLLPKHDSSDWYTKVMKVFGDSDGSYSHFSNVSTFAALFSLSLGIGNPEEMAMAGLFHDLGVSVIPSEIQLIDPAQWTPEQRQTYEKHPEHSIQLLKDRRVVIPESVQTTILQHHERVNGEGYPQKIPHAKIKIDAQLFAIADEFDQLTCRKVGVAALSPIEALKQIKASGGFNIEIVEGLEKLFAA